MMKFLLPVDGSETSMEAVHHAIALCRQGLRAEFVLANVQAPPTVYEIAVAPDAQSLRGAAGAAGAHLLAPAAARLQAAGLHHVREVAAGDPTRMLVEIAERHRCDGVIIGADRVGAVRGLLGGSVSLALLHDSPVPVTVVHRRAGGDDDSRPGGGSGHEDDGGAADGSDGGDGGGGD